MKLLRWTGLTAVAVFAAAAILYLAFPLLAVSLIERELAAYGFAVKELHIVRPGLRSWRVERAEIAGLGYEVQLVDLQVDYSWESLAAARATRVRIHEVIAAGGGSSAASDVEIGAILLQVPEQVDTLWRELPADALTLESFSVRTAAFAQADGELRGELKLLPELLTIRATADEFRLWLSVQRGGDLTLEASSGESYARFNAQRDISGTAEVDWAFAELARVSGQAEFAVDEQGWSLGEGLAVDVATGEGYRVDAKVQVQAVRGDWNEAADELLRARIGWQGAIAWDGDHINGSGGADLVLGDGQLDVEVSAGSEFASKSLATEDIKATQVRAVLPAATTLRANLSDLSVSLERAQLELSASAVDWLDFTLRPQLSVELQDVRVDAEAAALGFAAECQDLQLSVVGQAKANVVTAVWELTADLRQTLTSPLLQQALAQDVPQYDIDSGVIAVKLGIRGAGADTYAGDAVVTLDGLRAHYDEVLATGATGSLVVTFSEDDWSVAAEQWSLAAVDVGFPIVDISGALKADPQNVDLINVRGATLGGALRVEALRYDLEKAESQFVVAATGMQLSQVLALEGATLTGDATLDGQLPIRLQGEDVSVASGKFQARPPGGALRYAGATAAAESLEQTGVGFAIAALADFQFDVLDVNVNYRANGDLLLGIRLEGYNENFEAGRPIHYNLNVTENIPVLLQSLQLSDEVGRRLEQRLLD